MPYADPARQREYMRRWIADRRTGWITANGPCTDCETWDELEVDHADASLKVSHRVWSWARERREAELTKCVVRCTACHKQKSLAAGDYSHLGENNWSAKLTVDDVLMIRASALSLRALARQLKVDYTLIWQVRTRRIWKHV
jgi:hypothetical protein